MLEITHHNGAAITQHQHRIDASDQLYPRIEDVVQSYLHTISNTLTNNSKKLRKVYHSND